ncbi:MAG TPA: DUF3014 domain-containing protein [Noviherbaspirillum sp.]|nr:DUF3014 domain-containing protein [Noviherbaspirillum sp.]
MKKALGWLFVLILLGAAGFAYYLWQQSRYQLQAPMPAEAPSASADVPPAAAPTPPAIQYPVPASTDRPLPSLERSDPAVLAALARVFGKSAVKQFFQPEKVIHRIVVTIDNLPRKVVSAQLMPTKPVAGKLRTSGEGETLTLAQANFDRYTPFVRLAGMADVKAFSAAYIELYPLFQQAYRNLGYPKGYFNDRLVAVIDHMLDAPQSEGEIVLLQPHVYYKFADPELESLSAGHKLMLRIGNENAATIKKKLREIRSELVSNAPKDL